MVQPTFPTQKIAMVQGVDSEFGLGAMGPPGPAAGKVGGKRITSWMGRGRLLDVVETPPQDLTNGTNGNDGDFPIGISQIPRVHFSGSMFGFGGV